MAKKKLNGEGSITRQKRKGGWYYRGYVTIGYDADGKQKRETFNGYDKNEVLKAMRACQDKQNKVDLVKASKMTFGEWFLKWVNLYKKPPRVLAVTYQDFIVTYKNNIKDTKLNSTRVDDINLAMLQNFFRNLEKTRTPTQLRKIYKMINAALKSAVVNKYASHNCCPGLILPKVVPKNGGKIKAFSLEEQKTIMENLDLTDPIDQVIYFDFFTGLRLGEILGLKWSRVKKDYIEIKEQYQRTAEIEEENILSTKTVYHMTDNLKTESSRRRVALPIPARKLLADLAKATTMINKDVPIFNIDGKPIERKKPNRRIHRLCEELGFKNDRTFHSIRHTYATRLFEKGVDQKTVQSLLGHKRIETTMNVYTHVMKPKQDEAVSTLNDMFDFNKKAGS